MHAVKDNWTFLHLACLSLEVMSDETVWYCKKTIITQGGQKKKEREKKTKQATPGLLTANLANSPRHFPFSATIFFLFFFFVVVVFVSLKNARMIVCQQISTRWTQHQICIHTRGRGSEGGGAVLPDELPAQCSPISCVKTWKVERVLTKNACPVAW